MTEFQTTTLYVPANECWHWITVATRQTATLLPHAVNAAVPASQLVQTRDWFNDLRDNVT